MRALLVVIAVLASLLGGLGYRHLYQRPRRWRRPLEAAGSLVHGENREDLERAVQLIGQALNAGPTGRNLARARFTRSYALAMLGRHDATRYQAALSSLEELVTASGYDRAIAFLELWIRAELEQHPRVCQLYDEQEDLLSADPAARRIVAISRLERARESWRRRDARDSLSHLDAIRDLDELPDRLPARAELLYLDGGISALSSGRAAEARDAFKAAATRATAEGRSQVEAELGLLVCDWMAAGSASAGRRGALLTRVDARLEALLGRIISESADDARIASLAAHVAVLHLNSLLRCWLAQRPQGATLAEQDWAELKRRAQRVRDADPELGDADLIEGVLRYELAPGGPDHATGLLESSQRRAKGVVLPEIQQLLLRTPSASTNGRPPALTGVYGALYGAADPDPGGARPHRSGHFGASTPGQPPDQPVIAATPVTIEQHLRRIDTLLTRADAAMPATAPAAHHVKELARSLHEARGQFAKVLQRLASAEKALADRLATLRFREE